MSSPPRANLDSVMGLQGARERLKMRTRSAQEVPQRLPRGSSEPGRGLEPEPPRDLDFEFFVWTLMLEIISTDMLETNQISNIASQF